MEAAINRGFMKIFIVFLCFIVFSYAKDNYTQMSTQELIEIIGFVDEENKASFLKELERRIPKMSADEFFHYQKRLNEEPKSEIIEDEK